MNHETDTEPQGTSFIADVRRSSTDTMVAGVAGGIAARLRIDPIIVRIGFVVLTVVGLAGLLLYGAMWLLIPRDDATNSVAGKALGVGDETQLRTVGFIAVAILAVAVIVGDEGWAMAGLAAWIVLPLMVLYWFFIVRPRHQQQPPVSPMAGPTPSPTGGEHTVELPTQSGPPLPALAPREPKSYAIVAITLSLALMLAGTAGVLGLATESFETPGLALAVATAVIGFGLVVGAWRGNAGWLVPFGLVTSCALAISFVVSSSVWGPWGEITEHPRAVTSLAQTYEHGAGQFTLDLSDLTAADLAGRTITIDSGIGLTRVVVDESVPVSVSAEITAGLIDLFGETREGLDVESDYSTTTPASPDQLTIDIDHHIGNIEVTHP